MTIAVHRAAARDFAPGVASAIVDCVSKAVAERGKCTVSLAGGSTPRPVYERLAKLPEGQAVTESPVPWREVDWLFGDERCVPPDHEFSNYRMIARALFDGLHIEPAAIHRMAGEDEPTSAARLYQRELEKLLGESGRIDLTLLGLGEDGHTASIFPGSAALEPTAPTVLAVAAPPTSPVRDRLTLTLPALARSRTIYFLVAGEAKREALERLLAGDSRAPAARVAAAAQAAGARVEVWRGE
jgi:6-phosphogluconolactonase